MDTAHTGFYPYQTFIVGWAVPTKSIKYLIILRMVAMINS